MRRVLLNDFTVCVANDDGSTSLHILNFADLIPTGATAIRGLNYCVEYMSMAFRESCWIVSYENGCPIIMPIPTRVLVCFAQDKSAEDLAAELVMEPRIEVAYPCIWHTAASAIVESYYDAYDVALEHDLILVANENELDATFMR